MISVTQREVVLLVVWCHTPFGKVFIYCTHFVIGKKGTRLTPKWCTCLMRTKNRFGQKVGLCQDK